MIRFCLRQEGGLSARRAFGRARISLGGAGGDQTEVAVTGGVELKDAAPKREGQAGEACIRCITVRLKGREEKNC